MLNGNLLTLPVGGGLLYVQPLYVQRSGGRGQLPGAAVRRCVLRQEDVGIGTTFEEAIVDVLGLDTAPSRTGATGATAPTAGRWSRDDQPTGPKATQIRRLLSEASTLFAEADTALHRRRPGDVRRQGRGGPRSRSTRR